MTDAAKPVRTLFCFGVLPPFYDLDDAGRKAVFAKLVEAYDDLAGRFGMTVLGAIDDDQAVVGPSFGWPWTAYILADVPDHATIAKFCNILREFEVGGYRLWRYMKVEARPGRELFFGTK
jgi:hypothetical protein